MMLAGAIGLMGIEVTRAVRQWLEHRATTASWVLSEAPGLLDYEADGERAARRFTKELDKLSKDTTTLSAKISAHSNRINNAKSKPGRAKQKVANQAARTIDKGGSYIEKRTALFRALVKDIARNYEGQIRIVTIQDEADRAAVQHLYDVLQENRVTTQDTTTSLASYRDSLRSLEQQNPSRTVRIAAKRLADALDDLVKVFRQFGDTTSRLRSALEKKLSTP